MRQGKVYYKEHLAGTIMETDEGEYVFQYQDEYVKDYPDAFVTLTMPVRSEPYRDKSLFSFFEGLIPEDTEELALTLAGKKKKLKREYFEQLGKGLGLSEKQIGATFKRMIKNKPKAITKINESFLSEKMKTAYEKLLNQRYQEIVV